jgi:signal peptidase I
LVTKKTTVRLLLVISLVSAVGAVILYFQTPSIQKHYQMVTFSSASMEPTIKEGSLVLVDANINPADLNANYPDSDIIMFHNPDDPGQLIVHRIVAKTDINGTTCFYTKADANGAKYPAVPSPSEYDNWGAVSPDLIVGKVVTDSANSQMVSLTLGFWTLVFISIAMGLASLGLYALARIRKK